MLPPHERSLFLEALRPPPGHRLDRAVGTTFTLDLLTLLTTPLAFTFFDWETTEGEPTSDPLALLEALRRHAERIHLFCHAGQISVPPPDKKLLAYLESSVIEVLPEKDGALFHPKVWVLRFVAEDEPVRYRLLCLSRNLTFDRSWDTILVLDGHLTSRKNAFGPNHPLGDFVRVLPELALRRPPQKVLDSIERIQDEIRRVDFELPANFKEVGFVPMGIPGHRNWKLPESHGEMLVVSPFLGGGLIQDLGERAQIGQIVSRPEALRGIDPELLAPLRDKLWVMSPDGDLDSREGADEPPAGGRNELAGLHAKLFILEEGWDARVWTGSANATGAAFGGNVEFLVELKGRKSRCGREAFLGKEDDRHAFRSLLLPYELHEEKEAEDEDEERHGRLIEKARSVLARAALTASAKPLANEDAFELDLQVADQEDLPNLPREVRVTVRPSTLASAHELPLRLQRGAAHSFTATLEALTSFFVFSVSSRKEPDREPEEFVLNLPLRGAPGDRRKRLLESLLKDQHQVLRLLLLLLAGEGLRVTDFAQQFGESGGEFQPFGSFGTETLLESLLHALHHNPRSLEHAARVISDLESTPEGRRLLPNGLEEIWRPVWETHKAEKR